MVFIFDFIVDELQSISDEPRIQMLVRSLIHQENFNSRLRPYIDERRTLTKKTLGLYQFILNHRPFQRSYHPHLVGKTPAEALTGKPHPHWLELLGYQRFQRTELAA